MTREGPESSMANRPRVLIIGGGIGGLCLAQGLKRSGIPFCVYERDRTPDARLQGYRLSIEPVGSRALFDCLPPDVWRALLESAGESGQGMGVFDERLRELMREDPAEPSPPEHKAYALSRIVLRRLLLTGLEENVQFGKTFTRFEMKSEGGVAAVFEDGDRVEGDLLVGADGAGSRVRRQLLPDAREIETPGVGVGGKLFLGATPPAWLPQVLLAGKSMVLPRRDFLFTAAFRSAPGNPACEDTADYLMWAFVAHRSGLPAEISALRGQALRRQVEQRTEGWHPGLRLLISETSDDTIEIFPFKAAARVAPWASGPVTLLGDALHHMPPVGGLGGNTALRDAQNLRRALAKVSTGQIGLVPALQTYEAAMISYGFDAVDEARRYLELAISPSRLVRIAAKGFFRTCGAVPPLRRAVF